MIKYIVNCEVKMIRDTDEKGSLLLKPVIQKFEYARMFDTLEEMTAFLDGEMLPVVRVA